uniref:Uncharacterized protein n=1 Tax=Maylandia zebra TaxID=106582 RepID=A0A3P9C8L2_9CICH
IEAIISAAETGFTGSLSLLDALTRPAAYMGTMTGCFFCPRVLTMFLVSMPRQQSSALLQWEPPHWYLRPNASWIASCSGLFNSVNSEPRVVCVDDTSAQRKCVSQLGVSRGSGTDLKLSH